MQHYFSEIKPEPISDVDKVDLFGIEPNSESRCEFLRIKDSETYKAILNIKLNSDYSPTFKQSEIINDLVIVGYGDRFGIYNFVKREKIFDFLIEGYFSSFKINGTEIFIATDAEIINVGFDGKIKWTSEPLAVDGVIIGKISESQIEGSGEMDPPGGWIPFVIDRKTGKIIK